MLVAGPRAVGQWRHRVISRWPSATNLWGKINECDYPRPTNLWGKSNVHTPLNLWTNQQMWWSIPQIRGNIHKCGDPRPINVEISKNIPKSTSVLIHFPRDDLGPTNPWNEITNVTTHVPQIRGKYQQMRLSPSTNPWQKHTNIRSHHHFISLWFAIHSLRPTNWGFAPQPLLFTHSKRREKVPHKT